MYISANTKQRANQTRITCGVLSFSCAKNSSTQLARDAVSDSARIMDDTCDVLLCDVLGNKKLLFSIRDDEPAGMRTNQPVKALAADGHRCPSVPKSYRTEEP